MNSFKFSKIWLEGTWKNDLTFIVNEEGRILSITQDDIPVDHHFKGPALPGSINSHSHAFQYAMSGLTENNTGLKDDFWSWREIMYSIALSMDPEDLEAVASALYGEMLRNGYTQVVEFHYLHHDKSGTPYAQPAQMGESLVKAAENAGIGITLVPIFYQLGGFGKPPASNQARFISSTLDEYLLLAQHSKSVVSKSHLGNMGYGIHSLRAVDPKLVADCIGAVPDKSPFHIHISEQLKEVEDAREFLGATPVQWLSNTVDLKRNLNLVHATHLDKEEIRTLASSKSSVVLCPTTEGNLGDGIFPLKEFLNQGGNFSIGSDSHIGLSPVEELRWVDYQQRLVTHRRSAYEEKGATGEILFEQALVNGYSASGIQTNTIDTPLCVSVLDPSHPLIESTSDSQLINTYLYSGDSTWIEAVISYGKIRVENGVHTDRNKLRADFSKAMKKLKIR